MKFDRNINKDGTGKYALVKMRNLSKSTHWGHFPSAAQEAFSVLRSYNIIHMGNEGPGEQFFVIKHKDKYAPAALIGYANAIRSDLQEMEKILDGRAFSDSESKLYDSLCEWHSQILQEYFDALQTAKRIPD